MSAGAAASPTAPVLQLWRWVRNPAFWLPAADVFAVLTALVLPWSTSLVAIFALCWLGSTALFVDYGVYGRSLKRPICALPFAMFALAVVGTLWSDASWGERLYTISPAAKLLFLPGLFYHFERVVARDMGVRGLPCVAMTLASWITAFHPAFTLKPESDWVCGVFVKNYIDQSQEFALCTIALARNDPSEGEKAVAGRVVRRGCAQLHRQHAVRDRFPDGAGDHADHASGICPTLPGAARHRAAGDGYRDCGIGLCCVTPQVPDR